LHLATPIRRHDRRGLAIYVHNDPEQVGFPWLTQLDPRVVDGAPFTHALSVLWRSQHARDLCWADLTASHLQLRMVSQAVRRDRRWLLGHALNLPSRSWCEQYCKLMGERSMA
jgi:hypothetical protein